MTADTQVTWGTDGGDKAAGDTADDGSYEIVFTTNYTQQYSVMARLWNNGDEFIIGPYFERASFDMGAVSGDTLAAANFETMLDGTGGATLSLRRLRIIGTQTYDTAIIAIGGTGTGGYRAYLYLAIRAVSILIQVRAMDYIP